MGCSTGSHGNSDWKGPAPGFNHNHDTQPCSCPKILAFFFFFCAKPAKTWMLLLFPHLNGVCACQLCYQEGAIVLALPAPVSLLSCPEGGFTPCRGSGCCSHSTRGSRRGGRGWGPHRARGTLLPLLGAAFLESSEQSRWRDLAEVWGLRHVSGSEAASCYPYRERGLQVGQSRDHGETPKALEVQSPLLLCHPCFLLERFPFLIIFKDDYILSSNDLS